MAPPVARNLGEAVRNWLDFQVACKRQALLNESILAQPIVEFLQARHSGQVPKEYVIPQLANAKRGANRRVDFALLSPQTKRITCAIETKWVGRKGIPRQKIVDDLLRLELFRRHEGQGFNRFLLVGGEINGFKRRFEEAETNIGDGREQFLTRLLLFSDDVHIVRPESMQHPWRRHFVDFQSRYKVNLPKRFETQLVVDSTGIFVRLAVWRIKSSRKRTEIPCQL